MLKCVDPAALGLGSNFMQVVELALTYGFKGIELDLGSLQAQVESQGLQQATKFLKNAPFKRPIVALPMDWFVEDSQLAAATDRLHALLDSAVEVGCQAYQVTVQPYSNSLPYHQNFEFHSRRLQQLAEEMQAREIRLGVNFLAHPAQREGHPHPFISTAETLVALVKMTAAENLGVVVDTWNWHLSGGTPEMLTDLGRDRLVAVRVADFPIDSDIDSISEQERTLPRSDGTSQSGPLLTSLLEMGFKGPIVPAPDPSQLEQHSREQRVQLAAESLDAAWAAAKPPEPVSAS